MRCSVMAELDRRHGHSPPVPPLRDYTGHLLWLVGTRVRRDLSQRVLAEGISVTEWKILRSLYEDGTVAPSALADRTRLNRASLTKLADKLLEKGLIERAEDRRDRRARPLSLTPAGQAKLSRLAILAAENEAANFGPLSPSDRETLDRILTILGG
jgi:MarR family transcriptional regulator, lower aerobic nicotinate degradation pathway regulator